MHENPRIGGGFSLSTRLPTSCHRMDRRGHEQSNMDTPPTDSPKLNAIDLRVTKWMARHGIVFLRVALGIIFLWFGVLKFFPNLSPADELATRTIKTLSLGAMEPNVSRVVLAIWESAIGLGLLTRVWMRVTLLLLFVQMLGTVTPLALFPHETWKQFPIALTLEGQYIVKNIVLVSAGVVLGATVRGGKLVVPGDARPTASS